MSASESPSHRRPNRQVAPPPLMLVFGDSEIYLWGFRFEWGRVQRDLVELKQKGLICNEAEALAAQGYRQNCAAAAGDSLQAFAAASFAGLLQQCPTPRALVFHHSYRDNTTLSPSHDEPGFMSQVHYFPPALLHQFDLDHIPYLVSFASGCTGFLSMLIAAAGICPRKPAEAVMCFTADVKPRETTYDAFRERILTSDCCSGFMVGRSRRGYRLLGISYYSTVREIVPLVEIVKRTVQMVRGLAAEAGVDLSGQEVFIHYPNIFATAWPMVSQYLNIPRERQVLDGIGERAHCLSSDSVISISRLHGGGVGRLHIVINFGSGLHLGACLLKEEEGHDPIA